MQPTTNAMNDPYPTPKKTGVSRQRIQQIEHRARGLCKVLLRTCRANVGGAM